MKAISAQIDSPVWCPPPGSFDPGIPLLLSLAAMLVPLGRGRQPQGPPQMSTPWSMMMQPVTMNPGGQGADLENIPGFRPGMEMPVTTSSVPLWLLPKSRLMEAVEFTEPLLDVTITTTLDPPYLAIIIWELTRVGVDTHVRTFNCGSYVELFLRFRNAYERRKGGAAESELKNTSKDSKMSMGRRCATTLRRMR